MNWPTPESKLRSIVTMMTAGKGQKKKKKPQKQGELENVEIAWQTAQHDNKGKKGAAAVQPLVLTSYY
jgi:hypothetical protein